MGVTSGSENIAIINGTTNAQVKTIDVNGVVNDVAVNPTTGLAYVSTIEPDNSIYIIESAKVIPEFPLIATAMLLAIMLFATIGSIKIMAKNNNISYK